MRLFKGIAAILMLVLVMPLAHASTANARASKVQPDCCRHSGDSCCDGASKLCCMTQAPADTSLYPAQNISSLVLPAKSVLLVYPAQSDSLNVCGVVSRSPAQHSPPGLLIAATIVLRI
jgi:hypothetical protein